MISLFIGATTFVGRIGRAGKRSHPLGPETIETVSPDDAAHAVRESEASMAAIDERPGRKGSQLDLRA